MKNKFTQKELLDLGFNRIYEMYGQDKYHYYTFDSDFAESLMTNVLQKDSERAEVEMFNQRKSKPLSKEFVIAYIKEFK